MDKKNQQAPNEELTEREVEILHLLAEGQSNSQIAHQLSLALETVKWYNRRLYEKLNVANRTEAASRAHELGLLDGENKVISSSINIRHNLPAATTPFIGRESEMAELAELIQTDTTRLITILAPGGMGKTWFALETARRFVEGRYTLFPNGIFFIPLAQLDNPNNIVTTIAEQLGIQFYGTNEPKQQLLNYFRDKQILLVLDNFEHLLSGANLISEILETAPQVEIIVTSREKLNLHEETVFSLGGLHFPDWETPEDALKYTAVQLFMQSAKQARSDFVLHESDLDYLARICRLVQGMPLGLVLAAAWVEMLSLREIAEEINHSLDFLETDTRNLPDRQKSIRAVFEYSWKRLSEEQRSSFMKLAVFRGGFTRRAAQHITGTNIRTLQILLSKSLVMRVSKERYEIHELLRQYAEEELEQTGEVESTRDAHCHYYLQALAEREADIKGRRQIEALEEINADFENVRAAWNCAVTNSNLDMLNHIQEVFYWYCFLAEHIRDGEELLNHALKQLASQTNWNTHPLKSRISTRLKLLRRWRIGYFENPADNRIQILDNLEIAHQNDDLFETAINTLALGEIARALNDFHAALKLFETSADYFAQLNDKFYRAWALHFAATMVRYIGDYEQLNVLHKEALSLRQTIGDEIGVAYSLINLGLENIVGGHYLEGEKYARESLLHSESIGQKIGIALGYYGLAEIKFFEGKFDEAHNLCMTALAISNDINRPLGQSFILGLLSWIACVQSDYHETQHLCEQYELASRSEEEYIKYLPLSVADYGLKNLDSARNHFYLALQRVQGRKADTGAKTWHLPVAALLIAHDGQLQYAAEILGLAFTHERSATGWLEKWALISQLRENLRQELGQDAYDAAFERGSQLDLDNVISDLIEEFGEEA